ncbi:MAG: DUF2834 domain-containing protein [Cyanobacteria bacterium P01_A01_bin.105]
MPAKFWIQKIALGGLWLALVGYAFALAPPPQPDTATLIAHLSTGQWTDLNPWIVALFNVMGVWPVLYAVLALRDGQDQTIPAWPFVAGTFALGAFALLPYLILRQPVAHPTAPTTDSSPTADPSLNKEKAGTQKRGQRSIWVTRGVGLGCGISILALLTYGLSQGNWADFVAQWQNSRFIHVMGLDFCLLCALFPILLGDDMARRHLQNPALFWLVSLLPLVGPALYVTLRPPEIAEAQCP